MHLENIWENTYGEVINYCLRQGWEVDVKKGLFYFFFTQFFTSIPFCPVMPCFSQGEKKGGGGRNSTYSVLEGKE